MTLICFGGPPEQDVGVAETYDYVTSSIQYGDKWIELTAWSSGEKVLVMVSAIAWVKEA